MQKWEKKRSISANRWRRMTDIKAFGKPKWNKGLSIANFIRKKTKRGTRCFLTEVHKITMERYCPYCCCLVAQSCSGLCDPMDWSPPGSSILHYLPEFAQIHVHWVGDDIQPSHPLPPPSPFAFNLSQHQDLFISQATILERVTISFSRGS